MKVLIVQSGPFANATGGLRGGKRRGEVVRGPEVLNEVCYDAALA